MSNLHWYDDDYEVSAASCCHDDGDPFLYVFRKEGPRWANETAEELIAGPVQALFDDIEAAKRWAETTESGWLSAATEARP